MNSESIAINKIEILPYSRMHLHPLSSSVDFFENDIQKNGMYAPIAVIHFENRYFLVDGQARLEAMKKLKKSTIEANVIPFRSVIFNMSEYMHGQKKRCTLCNVIKPIFEFQTKSKLNNPCNKREGTTNADNRSKDKPTV